MSPAAEPDASAWPLPFVAVTRDASKRFTREVDAGKGARVVQIPARPTERGEIERGAHLDVDLRANQALARLVVPGDLYVR